MIQYPKQVHVTLPSVESWGASMNILKDPPKSLWTRKIDKVSETQEITNMIGEFSGDRICEMIKVYPRGINPMVSVSYSNYGTNGGQYRGVTNAGTWGNNKSCNDGRSAYIGQAKLPIPVLKDNAFRPPILTQYDLLPLSRLPRTTTKAWTQPGFISYANSVNCPPSKNFRQIEQNPIHYEAKPTSTLTIGQLLQPPLEVREVHEPLHIRNISSRKRARDITLHKNSNINGRIQEVLEGEIRLNKSAPRAVEYMVNDIKTEYYTNEEIAHTNVNTGKQVPYIAPMEGELFTKYTGEVRTSNVSSGKQVPYIAPMEGELHNKYTGEVLHSNVQTNKNSSQILQLEESKPGRQTIQNSILTSAYSGEYRPNSEPLKDNIPHHLNRTIPEYSYEVPKTNNIHVRNIETPNLSHKLINKNNNIISVKTNSQLPGKDLYEINARGSNLKPTLDLSKHSGVGRSSGAIPLKYKENTHINLRNDKRDLLRNKQVRFNLNENKINT